MEKRPPASGVVASVGEDGPDPLPGVRRSAKPLSGGLGATFRRVGGVHVLVVVKKWPRLAQPLRLLGSLWLVV
jgi:hypothetical protein